MGLVPSRARRNIERHLEILREGTPFERESLKGPVMLSWGNVFVFNRKMVALMAKQWPALGEPLSWNGSIDENTPGGIGCPMLTKGRATSRSSCEQYTAYPRLRKHLSPPAIRTSR